MTLSDTMTELTLPTKDIMLAVLDRCQSGDCGPVHTRTIAELERVMNNVADGDETYIHVDRRFLWGVIHAELEHDTE